MTVFLSGPIKIIRPKNFSTSEMVLWANFTDLDNTVACSGWSLLARSSNTFPRI
jgi:hypothetical protein